MKSNCITKKKIIDLLEIRDMAIKNYIAINLEEEISKLNIRISDIEKDLKKLSKKIEEESDNDYYQGTELARYHYTVEYDENLVSFENKELFKEWFLDNVYKKRAFKANSKAWDAIYEAIGERRNVEMAEEDNY